MFFYCFNEAFKDTEVQLNADILSASNRANPGLEMYLCFVATLICQSELTMPEYHNWMFFYFFPHMICDVQYSFSN